MQRLYLPRLRRRYRTSYTLLLRYSCCLCLESLCGGGVAATIGEAAGGGLRARRGFGEQLCQQ